MDNVLGKNVTVRIYRDGWKLYGCAGGCAISVSTSTVETSVTGSGLWTTVTAQKHAWSGSLEGFVNFDTFLTLRDLQLIQFAMTPIQIQFEWVDGAGSAYTLTGAAVIVNSSATGQVDSAATFTIEVQGTGALVQALDEGGNFMINETDHLLINSTDKIIL